MKKYKWIKEFSAALTVCNKEGVVIAMNDKAIKTFKKYGGRNLIGRNIFDCHSESSKIKLKKMMRMKSVNCYTIEKNGLKKLIYQSPWYQNKIYSGFVELSIEIPSKIPHFIRK